MSLVQTLPPMLLDDSKHLPFDSPDWVFEIKFDGYRMLAEFGAGRVELRTRNGADCTKWFPEVVASLATYADGPHVVDGEVCVLDELGRSDFNKLHARARRRRWYEGADAVTYCVFDVLVAAGKPVMGLPLLKRKARLAKLFPAPAGALLPVLAIPDQGEALFKLAVELQLEGLAAKRKDSTYQPGVRTMDWRKIKRPGAIPPERFKR